MALNNAIAGENAEMRNPDDLVHKAEHALDKISRVAGLTSAGKAFVTIAADPFHDTEISVDGMPDFRTHRQVTQVITRTERFVKPPNVAGPWSLNIFSMPHNQSTAAYPVAVSGMYGAVSANAYQGTFGTVTCVAGPANQQLYPPPQNANNIPTGLSPTNFTAGNNDPDDNYTRGYHRVIAAGFEVYMTASDLYNSGDVIVWKQPSETVQRYGVVSFSGLGFVGGWCNFVRGPPRTVQQAMTIPGSRRWRAKDGCYVPMLLSEEDIPFQPSLPIFHLLVEDTIPMDTSAAAVNGIVPIQGWPAPGGNPHLGPDGLSTNWFHSCGAFFDGLDPLASLTVVARFVVERGPSVSESDLIVLARPSPPADEIAWRIYTEMVRSAPSGVPVRDNALGSWFANLVGDLATEAVPVVAEIATRRAGRRKATRKSKGTYMGGVSYPS